MPSEPSTSILGPVFAIAWTDLRLLVRDRVAAFFTFVFPVIFATFFGMIYSGVGERGQATIGVVRLEDTPAAQALAADLHTLGQFTARDFADPADGAAALRRGQVVAVVTIPQGFSGGLDDLFASGKGPVVRVDFDPSRRAEAGLLEGRLTELSYRVLARGFSDRERVKAQVRRAREGLASAKELDPARRLMIETILTAAEGMAAGPAPKGGAGGNADPLANFRPMVLDLHEMRPALAGPTNAYQLSLPQGIVWGLMGCVTAFVATFAHDRSRGTLVRLLASPARRWQLVAGKALAGLVSCLIVQWLLIAIFVAVFGVAIRDPLLLVVATVCSAAAFVGVMMTLATIGGSAEGSAGFGRAVILVLAMIGGGTIPVFFMPRFLQTLSAFSPFTWSVRAIDLAVWREAGAQDVVLPLAVLLCIGVGGVGLGVLLVRRLRSSH